MTPILSRSSSVIALLLAAATLGCGGPSSSAAHAATNADTSGPCWWIWSTDATGTQSELWCGSDAAGRLVRTEPGIHVVVGGEDAELVVTEVPAAASRCGDEEEVLADASRTLTARRLDLVRQSGTVTLLESTARSGLEELEERIEVLGTLGPHVVVRRFTESFSACGEEADRAIHEHWLNMETGAELPMDAPTQADHAAAVRALLAPALASAPFRETVQDRLEEPATEADAVDFLEHGDGSLVVGDLWPELEDGRWMARRTARYVLYESADAFDAVIDGAALPEGASPEMPAIVAERLRSHGGAGGWTVAGTDR